jgi:hypothetical protein
MAEAGVTLEGADRFNRTYGEFVRDLADLTDTNRRAAEVVLDRADSQTPRSSGALAASGRVDAGPTEAEVVYDAEYAGVIHNGWDERNIEAQPWLAETFDGSTAAVTDVYVHDLDAGLDKIQGV